jgi:hypothetical protein
VILRLYSYLPKLSTETYSAFIAQAYCCGFLSLQVLYPDSDVNLACKALADVMRAHIRTNSEIVKRSFDTILTIHALNKSTFIQVLGEFGPQNTAIALQVCRISRK